MQRAMIAAQSGVPTALRPGFQRAFAGHAIVARQARSLSRRAAVQVSALAVGDKLPADVKLSYFDSEGNMQEKTVGDLTKGKKVVFVAVPGAFTPTCSTKHVPGFVASVDAFKGKGVDTVACISVNDAFVMRAWAKSLNADGKILMLADGSGDFTRAVGAELDLSDKGLGLRSRRYSMLADNGTVKQLNMEEGGAFTISGAEDLLKQL